MTRIIVVDSGRAPADRWPVEMVERKGTGHPDTLADGVAEAISQAYSRYTMEEFGEVAHHWVDKCMLIGGESRVVLGSGELIRPMTLLVVGKATKRIGERDIPVEELATSAARDFFHAHLPRLDVKRGLRVEFHLNSAVGAGRPARWYRPSTSDDLTPLRRVTSNDAVVCNAYAPLSRTERAVLAIERHLNGEAFKTEHPEIGSDIKVLATRVGREIDIVACVPYIADLTPTRAFYDEGKRWVAAEIERLARSYLDNHDVTVRLNTRDNDEAIYLTATGTAADTGDVGVVGRGNRINGLIAPGRTTSIEAPAGKNPTYHSGKIYAALALRLAQQVGAKVDSECYVGITTSTGNPLSRPDLVAVELADTVPADAVRETVTDLVRSGLDGVAEISEQFVYGDTPLW